VITFSYEAALPPKESRSCLTRIALSQRYAERMFDVAEARSLLARLREADPNLQVFGASFHRYAFEPRISESRLRSWEHEHGVELPSAYREFLTELGNGGAGPFYGIFPLGMWDGSGRALESWVGAAGDLRAAFPHREAWNLPASRFERPEEFDSDEDEDAWNEALDAEYYSRSLLDGAFWICHHGCALRTALVVTGPERGNVWFDGRPDNSGIVPHTDAGGKHLSFGDWYLDWLERSLREVSS